MSAYPEGVQRLIQHFSQLPGIGLKTAERLVFYLLEQDPATWESFAAALQQLDQGVMRCTSCFNFTQTSPCAICNDKKRTATLICVVARPQDVTAIEKTNSYQGVYHVLGGTIDPLEGRSHEQIRVRELLQRIKDHGQIKEIILALNPDMPGETTMLYLTKILKESQLKVSRLARGLPTGADLEFADEITLSSALKRREKL